MYAREWVANEERLLAEMFSGNETNLKVSFRFEVKGVPLPVV